MAAPQQDTSPDFLSMIGAVASAINPVAGVIINAFAPLAKQKLAAEINRHTDDPTVGQQIADNVIAAAQQVTGKQDPLEAAVAVRQDSGAAAAVQQSALDQLDKLMPLFDKLAAGQKQASDLTIASEDAASARAGTQDLRPMLARNIWVAMILILVGLATVMGLQVWLTDSHTPDAALLVSFTGLIGYMTGRLGDVYGWAFGGVQKNSADTVTTQVLKS